MNATSLMAHRIAKGDDKTGRQPVGLLALVQHNLQAGDAGSQQTDAPVIDACRLAPQMWRVDNEQPGHDHRCQADRDVDIENPSPAVNCR
jgi:hypothetical protein